VLSFDDWRYHLAKSLEPLAARVLDFWVGELGDDGIPSTTKSERWLKKDTQLDATIDRLFGSHLETAYMGALDRWTHTIEGTTALIILLDQFPRSIFRDSAKAFRYDKKALAVCLQAIKSGYAGSGPLAYSQLCLMPAMHAESIDIQEQGTGIFEKWVEKTSGKSREVMIRSLKSAHRHRDVIARFGRFPQRNKALGRESTEAELAFLQKPGSSF